MLITIVFFNDYKPYKVLFSNKFYFFRMLTSILISKDLFKLGFR